MRIQFSEWHAWISRRDLSNIDRNGVYAIGRDVECGERPNLLDKRIIYIGHSTGKLRARLNKFDLACRKGKGHAGGNSLFCEEIQKVADHEAAWERKKRTLSVAIWVPDENWTSAFPILQKKGKLLNYVETKLQVDFTHTNKRLPEYNKKFG